MYAYERSGKCREVTRILAKFKRIGGALWESRLGEQAHGLGAYLTGYSLYVIRYRYSRYLTRAGPTRFQILKPW